MHLSFFPYCLDFELGLLENRSSDIGIGKSLFTLQFQALGVDPLTVLFIILVCLFFVFFFLFSWEGFVIFIVSVSFRLRFVHSIRM